MKYGIIILLLITLVGCRFIKDLLTPSPLSWQERKELREKERCNDKYERLGKKCPMLLQERIDTVEVAANIDSQLIAKSFQGNQDVTGVDSIISRAQRLIDSSKVVNDSLIDAILNGISSDVKQYIIERPCLSDSIYIDTTIYIAINGKNYGIKVSFGAVPEKNNSQRLFLNVPPGDLSFTFEHKYQQQTKAELTLKEQAYKIWREFWWVLLIAAGIIVYFKFLR